MSINKNILYSQIKKMISKELFVKKYPMSECLDYHRLMYLIREVVYSNPVENCIIKSDKDEWIGLPDSKSLFKARPNCGLPIGNLTSQLFSNVYLSDFDHYVSKKLGVSAYGRYVDDFFMMSRDKNKLLEAKKHCERYLRGIGLKIHPKKVYLQSCYKGFAFLGTYIKPHRIYIGKRTKRSMKKFVVSTRKELQKGNFSDEQVKKWRSSINSYLGMMRHYKTYKLRYKVLDNSLLHLLEPYGHFNQDFTKFQINKKLYEEGG